MRWLLICIFYRFIPYLILHYVYSICGFYLNLYRNKVFDLLWIRKIPLEYEWFHIRRHDVYRTCMYPNWNAVPVSIPYPCSCFLATKDMMVTPVELYIVFYCCISFNFMSFPCPSSSISIKLITIVDYCFYWSWSSHKLFMEHCSKLLLLLLPLFFFLLEAGHISDPLYPLKAYYYSV